MSSPISSPTLQLRQTVFTLIDSDRRHTETPGGRFKRSEVIVQGSRGVRWERPPVCRHDNRIICPPLKALPSPPTWVPHLLARRDAHHFTHYRPCHPFIPETLYHRDDALLYIAYVMLIWAAPIPTDRWHCSLWP